MAKRRSTRIVEHRLCTSESLERRLLLSTALRGPITSAATAAWYEKRVAALAAMHSTNHAIPAYVRRRLSASVPEQSASPDPGGFTPEQIKSYYGFTGLKFGSDQATGAGQTIALIEAYDDPHITADLKRFDTAFGLSSPPSLQVVSQTGSATALPSADAPDPVNGSWATEESLDVEWAHALAPEANILVVECNSQNDSDLYGGVAYAASAPGVSVVSMSFGQSEANYTPAEVAAIDPTFVTPPGHQGITFLASSGDSGAYADGGPLAVSYPASSAAVVSVGGTSLGVDSQGNPASETGWTGSGGGISSLEPQSASQKAAAGSFAGRAGPDVSFDADPLTGVNICDSLDFGSAAPFAVFGGTSFSAPAWGAIIALTNQGRVMYGRPTLDGRQQTIPALYSAYTQGGYSSVFRDVVVGNNGFYDAKSGYDLVTGLGSPRVHALVPQLVSNTVHGTPPVIGAFTVNPAAENAGGIINLTASNITDAVGDVETVSFYRLKGSTKQLLGNAAIMPGGDWTLSVGTKGLRAGSYTYIAIATNNFHQNSAAVSVANKLVIGQSTPTIGSFVAQPGNVPAGTPVDLIASRVGDTTSSIASVAFYMQRGQALIFLGNGINRGNGKWTLAVDTGEQTPGIYHYMAIASATSGLVSVPFKAIDTVRLGAPIVVTVNTIADQVDPRGSKIVSLRDAISIADLGTCQVTIDFDKNVFAKYQTIILKGTTLAITNSAASTIIDGPAEGLAVSGNDDIEVLSIALGAKVTISNLSITEGSSGGSGGGISNAGTATLSNVKISGNTDSGLVGNGGGIQNTGTLVLNECTITGNTADNGNGGGLYNSGKLVLNQTTISNNSAFNGGGIGNSGTALLTDSLIAGNTASADGGGVQNAGDLTIMSSTISGNTADTGGGLYNSGGYQGGAMAVATLTNSTVANNSAVFDDGGIVNSSSAQLSINDSTVALNSSENSYGGINNLGTATISNSVVAENQLSDQTLPGVDVNGTFNSNGYNFIGKADGSGGWINSDITGSNLAPANPDLSPFGYFGGPTPTLVPVPGSPLIGSGSPALVPGTVKTDQRHVARISGHKVDRGAVEIQGKSPVALIAPVGQSEVGGTSAAVRSRIFY